ncbi:ComEA family DNA-binding protein [Pareuzebyella sediminis]|uniref:ComEA family DNA-binding protein n=1 Tax=Pareuzebyella sediminis TaxID=2607998 RepID=UPI0011EE8006|nr:helix-hairpin-helix domain-containing protein [Pareuzebyella sediminis]
MKNLKPHFRFNKQERSGVFFLLLFIIVLQFIYFMLKLYPAPKTENRFSVNTALQSQIDSLRNKVLQKDSVRYYPFNPNYITDYKGYVLGMSVDEIDRLHKFRSQHKFVNSAQDFQKITGVSDSLLVAISPYFKFPEWTQNIKKNVASVNSEDALRLGKENYPSRNKGTRLSDLNAATVDDLRRVRGIGEKLSTRIVKFRNRLGGFLVDEQLYDVYGLEPEVVARALKEFRVLKKPQIAPINLNTASVEELSKLVYIQKWVAESIVNYREVNGTIDSFDELRNIEEFPSDKIERIALYLSL